jgi:hypothetical protein
MVVVLLYSNEWRHRMVREVLLGLGVEVLRNTLRRRLGMTQVDGVAALRQAQERANTPQGANRFKRANEANATSAFITGCNTVSTVLWFSPQNRFDLATPAHSRGLIQINSVEGCSDFRDRVCVKGFEPSTHRL